jgi:hypothetical protein
MKKTKQILLVTLLVLAVSLFFSRDTDPRYSYLYSLKRIQEKIFSKLQFSPEPRVRYQTLLLNERLSELQTIVDTKQYDYILQSSLRYSATAGELTNMIKESNLTELRSPTIEVFKSHQQRLQTIINNYPKDQNVEWKYIQDDFNYLLIYQEQLSAL